MTAHLSPRLTLHASHQNDPSFKVVDKNGYKVTGRSACLEHSPTLTKPFVKPGNTRSEKRSMEMSVERHEWPIAETTETTPAIQPGNSRWYATRRASQPKPRSHRTG